MILLTTEFNLIKQVLIGNTGYGNVYLRTYAKYNNQSIINNSTNVSVQPRILTDYNGSWFASSGTNYNIKCTGLDDINKPANWNFDAGETILDTLTGDVFHEYDGKKNIVVSSTFVSQPWGFNATASDTVILPTIARKSAIGCASPFNITDNVTINIDTKNRVFRHTIRYSFDGSKENVIATNIDNSYSWATPVSMFTTGNMANKNSGNGYLTVETFNGTTSLGVSDHFNFTANVTNSNPEINASIIDINAGIVNVFTGNANILVKGSSNAQINAVANLKNGATLKSYRVVCADKTATTYPTSTINGVMSGVFKIYITDSRNNSNGIDGTSFSKQMLEYFAPYPTQKIVARAEQTSTEIKANISGNWWGGNFGLRQNSIDYSYRVRESGGAWGNWSEHFFPTISGNTFAISNLSLGTNYATNKAYDIQFILRDGIGGYELNSDYVTVSTAIIEIYDDEVNINGRFSIKGVPIFYD